MYVMKDILSLVKKNQIQMMQYRGYSITDKEQQVLDLDSDGFTKYIGGLSYPDGMTRSDVVKLSQLYHNGSYNTLVVYANYKEQVTGKDNISEIVNHEEVRNNASINKVIIIIYKKLNTDSTLELTKFPKHIKYEVISYENLYINPIKHKLSLPHQIINEEQLIALQKSIPLRLIQLPAISNTDTQCIWLGCEPGQIILINRSGKEFTSSDSVYYRLVRTSQK